jgi:hypothetical protein
LLVAATIAPCSVTPADAQEMRPIGRDDLARLLPSAERRKVCFAHRYDAAHLRRHPLQRVTAVAFLLVYRHQPANDNPNAFAFAMSLKRKGATKTRYGSGLCRELKPLDPQFLESLEPAARAALQQERKDLKGGRALNCYVECDGGGVIVERATSGEALRVHLDRMRMSTACGDDEDAAEVSGGADDRIFRLDKAPLATCRALQDR